MLLSLHHLTARRYCHVFRQVTPSFILSFFAQTSLDSSYRASNFQSVIDAAIGFKDVLNLGQYKMSHV